MEHISPIYLASTSPRRKELLERFTTVVVIPPNIDENSIGSSNPEKIAIEKLKSIMSSVPDEHVVIACDTVIDLNGEIIGKPRDEVDAHSILTKLSGKTHKVISGYAILIENDIISGIDTTMVRFRHLDEELIRRYIATGEPMDKAGGYGIQALGSLLIESINGDFFNVVGLPLVAIERVLEERGFTLMPGG